MLGLGPIGDMATRIARHRGYRVIGVDLVPERLERARQNGVEVFDLLEHESQLADVIRAATDGRGPDSVVDAVGMEAHGSPVAKLAQTMTTFLPDALAAKLIEHAGIDRLRALYLAVDIVRRGGTLSLAGVYGGMTDPMPMLKLFDKQIQVRMGQANVKRWVDDIMPLLLDGDPLGVDGFATHRLPLERGPEAYRMFQEKRDGAVKILLRRDPFRAGDTRVAGRTTTTAKGARTCGWTHSRTSSSSRSRTSTTPSSSSCRRFRRWPALPTRTSSATRSRSISSRRRAT